MKKGITKEQGKDERYEDLITIIPPHESSTERKKEKKKRKKIVEQTGNKLI